MANQLKGIKITSNEDQNIEYETSNQKPESSFELNGDNEGHGKRKSQPK